MLAQECRRSFETVICPCVKDKDEQNHLTDDGTCVAAPIRVGQSILLYGKKKSYFPLQVFVGPDWPMIVIVYGLIIVINVVVLGVVSPLGWPPVMIGQFDI